MKYLILTLLIMASAIGCDSECPNCGPLLPPNCTFGQALTESECLGETLSKGCTGFYCETEPPVSVPILIFDCVELDCDSMECGDIVFTNLAINDVTGSVMADVIEGGVDLGNAECGFFTH